MKFENGNEWDRTPAKIRYVKNSIELSEKRMMLIMRNMFQKRTEKMTMLFMINMIILSVGYVLVMIQRELFPKQCYKFHLDK